MRSTAEFPASHLTVSDLIQFLGSIPPFLLVLLLTLPIALAGCSSASDEDGEGGASGGDITALEDQQAAVEALMASAKEKNADVFARTEYSAGANYLEQAIGYIEEGNARKAKSRLKAANKKFTTAIASSEKAAGRMKEVQGQLTKLTEAFAAADKVNAKELSAGEYTDAVKNREKANKLIGDGDATKAKRYLTYALNSLERAISDSEGNSRKRSRAEEEKALMAQTRQKAIDAQAEELAMREMEYAQDRVRQAERSFEDGDFEEAIRSWIDARRAYIDAIDAAQSAIARNNGGGENISNGGSSDTDTPEVGEIDIPDIGIGDGGVNIASGIGSLFHGTAVYEADKGVLRLDWADGSEFQKDVIRLQGKPTHTHFQGVEGVGTEDYIIAGNTLGYYVINSSFEDGVRIKATVQFQLLLDKPFFEFVVMSNKGSSFYGIPYGVGAKIYEDGLVTASARSVLSPYDKKMPKDWVQKRTPYEFEIIYRKAEEKEKGILQVFINGEESCRVKTDRYRKGFPGLRWGDTKFIVESLEVSGFLDEEWATEALERAALGESDSNVGNGDFDF